MTPFSPRVQELHEAAEAFVNSCRTWVPIRDEPVLPGTPGPAWILEVALACVRFIDAQVEVMKHDELHLPENRRPQFAHGLIWFNRVLDGLLVRWGWPPREATDWMEDFFCRLRQVPSSASKQSALGGLSFLPLSAEVGKDGRLHTRIMGFPALQRSEAILSSIALDHRGVHVYETTLPGKPTCLIFIVTGGQPEAFALINPPVPSVQKDELESLQSALASMKAGAEASLDLAVDEPGAPSRDVAQSDSVEEPHRKRIKRPSHADFNTYDLVLKMGKQALAANASNISQGEVSKRVRAVHARLAHDLDVRFARR